MPQLADVIVVGGGVIGCSVAYHLARAGMNCVVLERSAIGAGASSVAAGMFSLLQEHLMAGPQFELGLASLKAFPDTLKAVHEASGIDPEYMQGGTLRLAFTEEEERRIRALGESAQPSIESSWLSAEEVVNTEPLISPEVLGALYTPMERQVRSARITQAYAQAAAHYRTKFQIGVQVTGLTYQGQRVTGVQLSDGSVLSADHVVVAAGPWSGLLTEEMGIRIPVRPVRGQIISLHAVPRPLRTSVYHSQGYLTPKVDGTVLVGATYEEAGFDTRSTASAVGRLLSSVEYAVPELATAHVAQINVGLRPGTPDEAPILGPVPGWDGLTLATGHFRSGILLSPITGILIAESVIQGSTSIPLEPFSVARFS